MPASNAAPAPPMSSGKPTPADIIFLMVLTGLLVVVVFLGRLTFKEGLKTEGTKAQAESLMTWMKDSSAARLSAADFSPSACAAKPANASEPNTWAGCLAAILASGGALGGAHNTFSGEPIQVIERCIAGDLATVGQLVVDKVVPTPPGSAVPVVVSPLAGEDRIDQRLQVRLLVCDKGGYAIRVGETDF